MQTASENKSFQAFVKEIVDRDVTGIVSVFGNIDDGGDQIHTGAFKKTIKENRGRNRIRHLWQHDWSQPPVAAIKELREVGQDELPSEIRRQYPTAEGGLLVKRTYLETERGNEILAALRSGALNEMSIGYDPIKYDFDEIEEGDLKGYVIRHLRELRLWDTSDVNWGMNPATSGSKAIVPFKSAGITQKEVALIPQRNQIEDWHYAYVNEEQKLFLHHGAHGQAHWLAVRDSMFELIQAKHDLTIMERRGIYNHLKNHYEEYGEPAPSFDQIELGYLLKQAQGLAVGDLAQFADSITSIRNTVGAEPHSNALTQKQIRRRLDLLSREFDF